MILYQTALSSVSRKLRVALALKGIEVTLSTPPGGSYRSAEYRALVPQGTVPALIDGALVLSESDAIIEYLEDLAPGLHPADPAARARARMISRLHDFRIDPPLRQMFALCARSDADPSAALADLRAALAVIEITLDPAGPFATGATPGLGDCAWPASFIWIGLLAARFDAPIPLSPRLQTWHDALRAHCVIAGAMAGYAERAQAWIAATHAKPDNAC